MRAISQGALSLRLRLLRRRAVMLGALGVLVLALGAGAHLPARAAWVQPLALDVRARAPELAPAQEAAFTPNPVIHFQGRLLDPASGLAKPDGQYDVIFKVWNLASGGDATNKIWEEPHTGGNQVTVSRGVFSVLLGDITALDPAVFNGQGLWLGITVGGDPEMSPRQRLAHVPYALLAERVKDGSVNSASVADGSLTLADLAPAARPPKFIDLNIFSAQLGALASLSAGFGPNAGLVLPNTSGQGNSFSFGFTLPPDYATGATIKGRFVWHANATNCSVVMAPNYISVSRVGRTHIVGGGASTGLNADAVILPVGGTANLSQSYSFSIVSPVPATPLQAGDTIIFGFYRSVDHASDTCAAAMVLQGASILY